jgi:REP element-mobilizing transposase RayT
MPYEYRVKDQYGLYFITNTVHQWVDVFTRKEYVDILLESLCFCQKEKGLKIYAWVVMSNHIHLIIQSDTVPLSDILRDFKRFTATAIIRAIEKIQKKVEKDGCFGYSRKRTKFVFGKKATTEKK